MTKPTEIQKNFPISKMEIAKTCAIGIIIPFAVVGFETFIRFLAAQ